jgi:hypothetical protein
MATKSVSRTTLEHRHYSVGVEHMREEIRVNFGEKTIGVFTGASLSQVLRQAANYIDAVESEENESNDYA